MTQRNVAAEIRLSPRARRTSVDDFIPLHVVGTGGFGKVIKVQERVGGRIFAMKVLRKRRLVETDQVESTKREQRILQTTQHPFVVKLRYSFQSSSKLFMVMDFYPGGSLFVHVKESGPFPEKTARFWAAEITLALDHLHINGIIHRDLKLENILLDEEGHVALTDFGLSMDRHDGVRMAHTICGSPVYLAPELIERQPYTFTVDWWALGVVLFEIMSGQVPFPSHNRHRMFEKILHSPVMFHRGVFSASARSFIGQLLIKDPQRRLGCSSGTTGGKDVQSHRFFTSHQHGLSHFGKIRRKEVRPPFKPPKSPVTDYGFPDDDSCGALELVSADFGHFSFAES